jgi:hypothetical protein
MTGQHTKAYELEYHVALLNLGAVKSTKYEKLITHGHRIAEILPLMGFYLQPSVGRHVLEYNFWIEFAEIENVVAVKIAPFDRYKTIDVVRAITESCREDIALSTGNDDNIIMDLLTPYRFVVKDRTVEKRIVGGLLGHWAVWTKTSVEMLNRCHSIVEQNSEVPDELLALNIALTDANAVIFDHAHNFAGCIAGIHEVLRRQGLLEGIWCLDPQESLSLGQNEEIDLIYVAYQHLRDDVFIQENLT